MKRSEYAEAVAAITEAIGLEPDAPNAYVGRALAFRSLEDEAAALRDEAAAKALGGPERSGWDKLVKRAYKQWRGDLRDPDWQRNDPISRKAFLLRQWTWQLFNGGLPQWVANGFGEWAEVLARAAEEVGTEKSRAVAAIVREVIRILQKFPAAKSAMFQMIAIQSEKTGIEERLFLALSGCEEAYNRIGPSFGADVESWLECQLSKSP
ncbi:MAG TPA: hypothetical protein VGJ05_19095 [Fimbriiglobus sp.]|jgi:hypothetical protein